MQINPFLPLALIAGMCFACGAPPTARDLQEDIGPAPSHADAKRVLSECMRLESVDPLSPDIGWSPLVERSWFQELVGGFEVAWQYRANIHKGHDVDHWSAWFKSGEFIALTSPSEEGERTRRVTPVSVEQIIEHGVRPEMLGR